MPYLLAAESMGKSFGSRRVLSTASLWARAGEITAVFGRNGCGKSTLLRISAGLISADHGVVTFDGITHIRPRLSLLARRGLFFLPERGLLSRRMTVLEQADVVARFAGRKNSDEVLERLGVRDIADRPIRKLSGGERRRSEIALALIRRPRCLLADEPFAGVSPRDANVVAEAFRELAEEGCAIVITGHEVPQLMGLADQVIWSVAGTTHALGTPSRAMAHDQFRREYLGSGWIPSGRKPES